MKKFKKGQRIIATLPTGREVEGYYMEPYSSEGHSIYVLEFNGLGRGGEPTYKKAYYGVSDGCISEAPTDESEAKTYQYKAWLKRAMDLEARIKECEKSISSLADSPDKEREVKKLARFNSKLAELNKKINEYEGKET